MSMVRDMEMSREISPDFFVQNGHRLLEIGDPSKNIRSGEGWTLNYFGCL